MEKKYIINILIHPLNFYSWNLDI